MGKTNYRTGHRMSIFKKYDCSGRHVEWRMYHNRYLYYVFGSVLLTIPSNVCRENKPFVQTSSVFYHCYWVVYLYVLPIGISRIKHDGALTRRWRMAKGAKNHPKTRCTDSNSLHACVSRNRRQTALLMFLRWRVARICRRNTSLGCAVPPPPPSANNNIIFCFFDGETRIVRFIALAANAIRQYRLRTPIVGVQ